MNPKPKAYIVGGGIGALAVAAFLVRDARIPGGDIALFESASVVGGSLDAAGNAQSGYSLRGGRMLTTDNYECTWDLFKSIPSLTIAGASVYDETVAFNQRHPSHALARLVDRHRAKVPVRSMGFSMQDRIDLLKLSQADEATLGASRITDWLSPAFFDTSFWYMWATTFAFQPWHSAVEFRRYLHRFLMEFTRIDTLAGVRRTVFNQYDSMVLPLLHWLAASGVQVVTDCTVTELLHTAKDTDFRVTGIRRRCKGIEDMVDVAPGDLVFFQNGSMTDASSLGSMHAAPARLDKRDSGGWSLWEALAAERPAFGRPTVFNSCIAQSCWESFTVTLRNSRFFDENTRFSGNVPGTGGLVTFKDSNWMMSIVLAHQPHFAAQSPEVQVFWGYALLPDRVGNFVAKPMDACNGGEILQELCGHLRLDPETFEAAICIPCRMPYITSMFMPRSPGDRPQPVPDGSSGFAFVSQFVEIPGDVVFTVEYSVRAAQMAVYRLCAVDRPLPSVTPHDRSLKVQFEALVKAFA